MSEQYKWLVYFPDRRGGWLPYLRRAGAELLKGRRFDLIYASGPPFTTFVAAARLSKDFGVPWIAEYRDGWTGDPYGGPKPAWRERIDKSIERRTLRNAAGVVAVSAPWAEHFRRAHNKPTIAIYNGFDDVAVFRKGSPGSKGLPVTIVHMGTIYAGMRDPTVLFQAIKRAGIAPGELEVAFYGAAAKSVYPLVEAAGVEAFVKVPPRVSYDSALEIQRTSDVLLLLQSPVDARNVPAKTFEYFAARRPILGLGLDEGIPARLVRERGAGLYVTDADVVAAKLKDWIAQKRQSGSIAELLPSTSDGLSRKDQFVALESFIASIVADAAAVAAAPETVMQRPPGNVPVAGAEPVDMLPRSREAVIAFPRSTKPQLLVIIDAEEEFDWSKPFSAAGTAVTNMKLQLPAQTIFARFGIVPSYTVDYAVAAQPDGYRPLLEFLADGRCEIGAQLHPWITPPLGEEIGERNSYPGNLPEEIEYAKLRTLTERIEGSFGLKPRLYRAGRFGAGPNTARTLRKLGYTMDCSVLPQPRRPSSLAPDFSRAPVSPYWIGEGMNLLEIPVTRGTTGAAHHAEGVLAPYLHSQTARSLRLPAILARLRLLDQIRLSPEGTTLTEARRLTRFLLSQGHSVFVVTYHTPSLGIGHTPYVRSERDLQTFLAWLEGYFEFFFGDIKGEASTPSRLRDRALALARPQAAVQRTVDSMT